MDEASCTEISSVDRNENIVGAEITAVHSSCEMERTEHHDPSIQHVRSNEFSATDKYARDTYDQKLLLDPSLGVAEDEHLSFNGGLSSDSSQRLQVKSGSFIGLDGSDSELYDGESCGADCLDAILRDHRSLSPECASIPDPECSPDSVDEDFFSRSGSDRGRDPFRRLFRLGISADRSLDSGSDLSFESFCRSSVVQFVRRFSRQRSTSVPPRGKDENDTVIKVRDSVNCLIYYLFK